MGKILHIAIYSTLLVLVFLLMGSVFKSCSNNKAVDISGTAEEVTENIAEAGGEVVARAESAVEDLGEAFEGGDIDYSSEEENKKTFEIEKQEVKEDKKDSSPSYVLDEGETVEEPVYKPEPVKKSKTTPTKTNNAPGNSTGSYLLITGNYSQEFNADAMVKKLKKKGFNRAEHVIFDGSRYYTAVAGRYNSMSEANAAKSSLGGIDAYVQKRRL